MLNVVDVIVIFLADLSTLTRKFTPTFQQQPTLCSLTHQADEVSLTDNVNFFNQFGNQYVYILTLRRFPQAFDTMTEL